MREEDVRSPHLPRAHRSPRIPTQLKKCCEELSAHNAVDAALLAPSRYLPSSRRPIPLRPHSASKLNSARAEVFRSRPTVHVGHDWRTHRSFLDSGLTSQRDVPAASLVFRVVVSPPRRTTLCLSRNFTGLDVICLNFEGFPGTDKGAHLKANAILTALSE